jgi:hypothetical protein
MILKHQNISSFFHLTNLTWIFLHCAFSDVSQGCLLMEMICYKKGSCKVSHQCAVSRVSEKCRFVKTICYKMNSYKVSLQCALSHDPEGCFFV